MQKGKPKNYIPEDAIRPLAAAYLKGEPVEGEIAVITRQQAEDADYNLSPSRWVGPGSDSIEVGSFSAHPYAARRSRPKNAALSTALTSCLLGALSELGERSATRCAADWEAKTISRLCTSGASAQ